MKRSILTALVLASVACAAAQPAETPNPATQMQLPEMPKPQKEHEWLKQLTGEWDTRMEINMPGMDPMSTSGTESARSIGGFWTVAESKGSLLGEPFTGILTLGYSPEKSKYIGTWIDSSTSRMWNYEGTLDEAGKILTLNTEGPCPMQGGKIVKMQETLEMKTPDHKVFTSKVDDNGKWITGVTINSYRKK